MSYMKFVVENKTKYGGFRSDKNPFPASQAQQTRRYLKSELQPIPRHPRRAAGHAQILESGPETFNPFTRPVAEPRDQDEPSLAPSCAR